MPSTVIESVSSKLIMLLMPSTMTQSVNIKLIPSIVSEIASFSLLPSPLIALIVTRRSVRLTVHTGYGQHLQHVIVKITRARCCEAQGDHTSTLGSISRRIDFQEHGGTKCWGNAVA
eukprot:6463320-Amphidinium_carterae.2